MIEDEITFDEFGSVEELLGAYIEGNLSNIETEYVSHLLEQNNYLEKLLQESTNNQIDFNESVKLENIGQVNILDDFMYSSNSIPEIPISEDEFEFPDISENFIEGMDMNVGTDNICFNDSENPIEQNEIENDDCGIEITE